MKCKQVILLLCIFHIAFGLNPPSLPEPDARHDAWIKILKKLYDRTEASIGFCFGSDPQKLLRLVGLSFPWPLPVMESDTGDSICSNRTTISAHLCGPDSIETYYRFMLLTTDPEKVPPTRHCPAGGSLATSGCAPGFFAAQEEHSPDHHRHHRDHHHHYHKKVAHPCCPGYFCPSNLVCMMPCPLGAHCPRSTPELPPKPFQNSHRRGSRSKWCAPYAYRCRIGLGCGGADKWTIIPDDDAFPGTPWDAGTGSLYCKPRYYCPNTTGNPVPCPRGKFCRRGSTEPVRCAPGAFCPALTEVPISNFGGVVADALLLCMLGVLWWASALRRRMLVRLGPRERLKVTWTHYGPRFTVVKSSRENNNNLGIYTNGTIAATNNGVSSSLVSSPSLSPQSPFISTAAAAAVLPEPLEIEFKNLSLRVKSCGRLVLANVSAKLKAAKLTAIMGASGAGKSSLLCALAGRAPYGEVSGTVYINGQCTNLELYRRITGFVPQDDVLYAALSVEENLMFSARYRLPAGTSEAERRMHVDNALVSLGLEGVRRDIVGDEAQRGLSGGQRKRVSIGVELVAAPRILLLDEPTSGLDAASAHALISTLLTIVDRDKVTAAAVVHQPRHEAFLLFDDVLLLGGGGRTAFYGPVDQVENYFLSLGHRFHEKTNPADALLDILASESDAVCDAWVHHQWDAEEEEEVGGGGASVATAAAGGSRQNSPGSSALFNSRLRAGSPTIITPHPEKRIFIPPAYALIPESGENISPSSSQLSSDTGAVVVLGNLHEETAANIWVRMKETAILAAAFALKLVISTQDHISHFFTHHVVNKAAGLSSPFWRRKKDHGGGSYGYTPLASSALPEFPPSPGFWQQFIWCLSRAATLRSREPVQTFTDIAIIAATGTTIGLLSDRGRATIMSYASQVSYSVIALGLMATVGSIPTFTENEAAFRREAASGLNRGAYFTALSFFDFIGSCIRAAAYLATWASFANPKTVLWQMYLVSLGLFWFCSGCGYILALTLGGSGTAQLAAAVITLIATLVARQPATHGLLSIIQQVSFARWALEGFVIAESNRLSGVWLLARCADLLALNYDVRRFKLCLGALTVLGFAARGLALCMLLVSS